MKRTKLLAGLMAVALSISCFAATPIVSNAAEYYTSGDFTFYLDNGYCVISGYSGSAKNVVIPATIGERTVVAIAGAGYAHGVFEGNREITSVTIPDTIRSIGSKAFYGCSSLTDVELGNGLKYLDYNCFGECDALTSIDIPVSLTSSDALDIIMIITNAGPFAGCDSLKTVNIESGGVKIPGNLFNGCISVQEITIPEGIQIIGGGAFSTCNSLEEIKIPDTVQNIGTRAFYGCKSLKKVTISNSDQIKINSGAFYKCPYLEDFYDYSDNAEYFYANPNISWGDDPTISDTPFLTIHGFSGSNAEKYAKQYGIPFAALSEKQMHRLYNINSGEHLYTDNAAEKENLVSIGWVSEGTAWIAPASSSTPVYRVYNPNSGEHHYTTNANEKTYLVSLGWRDEGIGWYSDESQGTALYRLYNPNASGLYEAGGHHYTKSVNEKNDLINAGWKDEGIGWYGC